MKTYSSNVVTPEDLVKINERQDAAITQLKQDISFLQKFAAGVFITNLLVTLVAFTYCSYNM